MALIAFEYPNAVAEKVEIVYKAGIASSIATTSTLTDFSFAGIIILFEKLNRLE